MICSLFNFCPQSAQSRRHGGGFGGLSPQSSKDLAQSPPKLKSETP